MPAMFAGICVSTLDLTQIGRRLYASTEEEETYERDSEETSTETGEANPNEPEEWDKDPIQVFKGLQGTGEWPN